MKQAEIIQLAQDCGLLFFTEEFPKSAPAQQRLISRLMKFAEECYNQGYDNGCLETIEKER